MSWLKSLFGGKPKAAPKKPASGTPKATDRAAVMAEVMNAHRRGRAQARKVLEDTLKDLQAKPLNPRDVEGMTRLLSLRRAILGMKGGSGGKSPQALDELRAMVKPRGPKDPKG
jgi:hypothetical protein